jgi:HPt (histidine-containing phosphotransfer) domain-containing protein
MGDEQFLSDLLKEFIEHLPDMKGRIVEAIAHKNASTLAKEAGLLAGAAGNLGADGLSEAAFDLEVVSRRGLLSEVNHSFRKLEKEVNDFVEYAQAH